MLLKGVVTKNLAGSGVGPERMAAVEWAFLLDQSLISAFKRSELP